MKIKDKKLIVGITAPGSVILIEGQLKYFTDLGYETYLIAPEDERTRQYCEKEGCVLLPVTIEREISLLADLRSLFQIIRHFRKVKPDIVNVGTPKMGLLGIITAKLTGVKKRIYTCRGFRFETEKGFKRKLLIILEKITSSFSHKVICISPSVKSLGQSLKIFSNKKATLINFGSSNGISVSKFNKLHFTINKKKEVLALHGITNCFVYGFVGRLVFDKGIKELFEAFELLYKTNNNIRLLMVGSSKLSSSPENQLISNYKSHSGIIFIGPTTEVPLYMSIMDVFILPTYREGFGVVLVEAAAMGLPIITTQVTGASDAVKNNFNGILIPPKSASALADTMKQLYYDKDLRIRLGKNGEEWAKNFGNEIIWEGMQEIYLEINSN